MRIDRAEAEEEQRRLCDGGVSDLHDSEKSAKLQLLPFFARELA